MIIERSYLTVDCRYAWKMKKKELILAYILRVGEFLSRCRVYAEKKSKRLLED